MNQAYVKTEKMKQIIFFLIILFGCSFAQGSHTVHVITLDGVINPVATDFIRSTIKEADAAGSE
ncbi:hypothetical protein B1H10_01415 [candidate division KSB1 bacterium 4484_188]|nr:MAG: hypothetical protein B1H10_01415 [candidate division KSB1 bacterium 4484_188]